MQDGDAAAKTEKGSKKKKAAIMSGFRIGVQGSALGFSTVGV